MPHFNFHPFRLTDSNSAEGNCVTSSNALRECETYESRIGCPTADDERCVQLLKTRAVSGFHRVEPGGASVAAGRLVHLSAE